MYESTYSKTNKKQIGDEFSDTYCHVLDRSYIADYLLSFVFAITGSILLLIAEKDISSVIFVAVYAIAGIAVVALFKGNRHEYRAYMLVYSLCVLIIGVSYTYSLTYFNSLMSTTDAKKFIKLIYDSNTTIEQLKYVVDATLPVLIWKKIAAFKSSLGFNGAAPGVFILFNSLLVALSGVFATKIANMLYSDDVKRVRMVGSMFAICGMCWLFGSLLIRDSYALLLNTVSLWAIVKVLVTPNIRNATIAVAVSILCAGLMWYVREKAFYLFFMFLLLGILIWYLKTNISPAKISVLVVLLVLGVIAYEKIGSHASLATEATTEESQKYTTGSSSTARSGSLGASLVVNQPIPVRLVVGSAYVIIFPIPLWGYFQAGLPEYFWIKGWHGLFTVLIMPFVIFSIFRILGKSEQKETVTPAGLFLVLYFVVTLMLVGVTTLETRHYGQFLSALIVLSAMPSVINQYDRIRLNSIRMMWFGMIVGGHVLWMAIR